MDRDRPWPVLTIGIFLFRFVFAICEWRNRTGSSPEKRYAVSSTRLRYESTKPSCNCELFFGDKDRYNPVDIGIENMEPDGHLYPAGNTKCIGMWILLICYKIIKEQVEVGKQRKNEQGKDYR